MRSVAVRVDAGAVRAIDINIIEFSNRLSENKETDMKLLHSGFKTIKQENLERDSPASI